VVSHDRDFLDRVATVTVAMEGGGQAVIYAGGWSDYQAQRRENRAGERATDKPKPAKSAPKPAEKAPEGLTFTEAHRLKELPAVIARLEAEIAKLTELLSDPDLFTREPVKFRKATDALVERHTALAQAEEDWLTLEDKASAAP
jgi:ATP-binding cassette subfamily F protein uup